MTKLRIIVLPFALTLAMVWTSCNEKGHSEEVVNEMEDTLSQDLPFPDSWIGVWKGDLLLTQNNIRVDTLPVVLDIHRIDMNRMSWSITYDTTPPREYELIQGKGPGHFIIDEKNSVELDGYYRDNEFTSLYSVNDIFLSTHYLVEGNTMNFTIRTYPEQFAKKTGGEIISDELDSLKSYKEQTVQRAILHR